MKTKILLQRNPNASFADVARKIAKGDPPKSLVLGLTQFSNGNWTVTSDENRRFDTMIQRMDDAAGVLLRGLPMWEHLPFGLQCPDDVAVVLDTLPRIKKDLNRVAKQKQIGRRPNAQREICAAVIVEAWKIIHGRPKLRSDQLLEACSDYWRACGAKQIGGWDNPENWRRTVKRALRTNHSWIGQILLAVQNEH
jgi:hypothetical protein